MSREDTTRALEELRDAARILLELGLTTATRNAGDFLEEYGKICGVDEYSAETLAKAECAAYYLQEAVQDAVSALRQIKRQIALNYPTLADALQESESEGEGDYLPETRADYECANFDAEDYSRSLDDGAYIDEIREFRRHEARG